MPKKATHPTVKRYKQFDGNVARYTFPDGSVYVLRYAMTRRGAGGSYHNWNISLKRVYPGLDRPDEDITYRNSTDWTQNYRSARGRMIEERQAVLELLFSHHAGGDVEAIQNRKLTPSDLTFP